MRGSWSALKHLSPFLLRSGTRQRGIMRQRGLAMNTFTVEVQVPEALRELGYTAEQICRDVPTLLVLRRFRQGTISSSKAAHILGLSRRDFLDLLAREGIPLYDPTDEQLADELRAVQGLRPSP